MIRHFENFKRIIISNVICRLAKYFLLTEVKTNSNDCGDNIDTIAICGIFNLSRSFQLSFIQRPYTRKWQNRKEIGFQFTKIDNKTRQKTFVVYDAHRVRIKTGAEQNSPSHPMILIKHTDSERAKRNQRFQLLSRGNKHTRVFVLFVTAARAQNN